MKYLKSYNESLYGEVSRLNPNRLKNDEKLYDLFDEIKEDFDKYDKDLRKVKIIRGNGSVVKIGDSIDLGMDGSFHYLFGKYHPVTNDHHTANEKNGKRLIKISYVPFSIVFRKNSLEKMFGTSRINPLRITVTDKEVIDNPDYNPNISNNLFQRNQNPTEEDRKKMVRYHYNVDEYRVSPDMAGKVMKFFIKEYNLKYPKLSKSEYKSSMQMIDIDAGVEPVMKYGSVISKDGKNVTYSIRYGEDEKSKRKMISNMTSKEYDEYYKKKNKEMYKPYNDKQEKIKKEKINEISNIIDKYNIDFKYDKFFKNNKYEVRYFDYRIEIAFMIENDKEDITENKVKKLIEDEYFNSYKSNYHIKNSYNNDKKWVTINLEK